MPESAATNAVSYTTSVGTISGHWLSGVLLSRTSDWKADLRISASTADKDDFAILPSQRGGENPFPTQWRNILRTVFFLSLVQLVINNCESEKPPSGSMINFWEPWPGRDQPPSSPGSGPRLFSRRARAFWFLGRGNISRRSRGDLRPKLKGEQQAVFAVRHIHDPGRHMFPE